jgi:hypothetical protein
MLFLSESFYRTFAFTGLILTAIAVTSPAMRAENGRDKITFDLSAISPAGLIGNQQSLRSVGYEFCIPAQADRVKEVKAIDPTVQFSRSRGRIGCQKHQYLCIGETHQPDWKTVLLKLAGLNYVKRIDRFWGE